jgi:hypothetical protein
MFMFPTIKLNIERWKYNPTFQLWVSNKGHFRNRSKAPIAPKVGNNGYLVIKTCGSNHQRIAAHRLVMLTWRPTPEAEILTVDHLDHNKRNNALDNLEWVTAEENLRRAQRDLVCVDKKNDIIYLTITPNETLQQRGMKNSYTIKSDFRSVESFIDDIVRDHAALRNLSHANSRKKLRANARMVAQGCKPSRAYMGLTITLATDK